MKSFHRLIILLFFWASLCPIRAQERAINDIIDEVYTFFRSDSIIDVRGLGTPDSYKNQMQISGIQRNNTTYLYVINMPDSGWAVVSNEQRYPFLIGYSTESYFDMNPDDQPGALKLLLELHMDMIDSLRESPSVFYNRTHAHASLSHLPGNARSDMDSILLKRNGKINRWNQCSNNGGAMPDSLKVYNKFCPTWYTPCTWHTYTGCTSVAIAQVLWYWRWPDYAYIKDYINMAGTTYGTTRRHYYDWDNMPASINNDTPMYKVDMIAGLLRDCGYVANTIYTGIGSSADVVQLEQALNAFNMHWTYNFNYAWTDVTSLLLEEIQAERPVICQAGESGSLKIHTFVIDGYSNTTGLFHVNFGWGWNEDFTINSMWNIGFNGYTVARSFFTELYPICDAREADVSEIDVDTIKADKAVTLYSANNVSLGELVVEDGGHLNVSVGGTIILGSGFNAQLGSIVKLAPNYNCTLGTSGAPVSIRKRNETSSINSINNENLSVTPNPAMDKITIHCSIPIKEVSIFNVNGLMMLQTTQMQIDISHFPLGVYIIRAVTKDGNILQTKIIHK